MWFSLICIRLGWLSQIESALEYFSFLLTFMLHFVDLIFVWWYDGKNCFDFFSDCLIATLNFITQISTVLWRLKKRDNYASRLSLNNKKYQKELIQRTQKYSNKENYHIWIIPVSRSSDCREVVFVVAVKVDDVLKLIWIIIFRYFRAGWGSKPFNVSVPINKIKNFCLHL